ncbi:MAG TPA: hypothetical protein VHZ27_07055 [Solirubrobacteraceae bacterium]|nr:hypothetical protein [Solirubrobacteraceae bacterium]
MTEPFADEHAPEVAASGAGGPAGVPDPAEPNGVPKAGEPAGAHEAGEPAGAHEAGEPAGAREAGVDSEEEVVDGFPVLAEVRTVERVSAASLPAMQAAAAAATGFVAGAATVALVRRRHARKLARTGRSGPRRAVDMLPIVGSRSFLVDVHVIGKQGD